MFALQAGQSTPKIDLEDPAGAHWYNVLERKPRPLDADQRGALLTAAEGVAWPKAFEDWYAPKKETAEADGVITRDDSFTGGGTEPGVDELNP